MNATSLQSKTTVPQFQPAFSMNDGCGRLEEFDLLLPSGCTGRRLVRSWLPRFLNTDASEIEVHFESVVRAIRQRTSGLVDDRSNTYQLVAFGDLEDAAANGDISFVQHCDSRGALTAAIVGLRASNAWRISNDLRHCFECKVPLRATLREALGLRRLHVVLVSKDAARSEHAFLEEVVECLAQGCRGSFEIERMTFRLAASSGPLRHVRPVCGEPVQNL